MRALDSVSCDPCPTQRVTSFCACNPLRAGGSTNSAPATMGWYLILLHADDTAAASSAATVAATTSL